MADYAVQAERPNRLRIVDLTTTYDSRYIKDNKGGISVLFSSSHVSDGKQQLEWDNLSKTYTLQLGASTITTRNENFL